MGILSKENLKSFKGIVFENSVSKDDFTYANFKMEFSGLPEEIVFALRIKFAEFWDYIEEQIKKEK